MIRVSVIYSIQENADFNFEYYLNQHMPLVEKLYSEFGLKSWQVDEGKSLSSKHPAPTVAAAYMFFDSIDSVKAAFKNKGAEVMEDTKNFTNIEPSVTISEIAAESTL